MSSKLLEQIKELEAKIDEYEEALRWVCVMRAGMVCIPALNGKPGTLILGSTSGEINNAVQVEYQSLDKFPEAFLEAVKQADSEEVEE